MVSDKRRHSRSSFWEAETRITQDKWQTETQTPSLHICHFFSCLSFINFDRNQAGGGHRPDWFGMALVCKSWVDSLIGLVLAVPSFLALTGYAPCPPDINCRFLLSFSERKSKVRWESFHQLHIRSLKGASLLFFWTSESVQWVYISKYELWICLCKSIRLACALPCWLRPCNLQSYIGLSLSFLWLLTQRVVQMQITWELDLYLIHHKTTLNLEG